MQCSFELHIIHAYVHTSSIYLFIMLASVVNMNLYVVDYHNWITMLLYARMKNLQARYTILHVCALDAICVIHASNNIHIIIIIMYT